MIVLVVHPPHRGQTARSSRWNLDAGLILGAIARADGHALHLPRVRDRRRLARGPAPRGCRSRARSRSWLRRCRRTRARGQTFAYWLHVLIVLTFLNYLPYSKHIHLLGALPNIFFAQPRASGGMDLPKLESRGRERSGASASSSSSRGRACWTATRAPSARAARTTARRTTPARTCRRCSSSTTSATRCSIASQLRDEIARAEEQVIAASPSFGDHTRITPACTDSRGSASASAKAELETMPQADRRPRPRRHAVGVHDVRRVPGGVPGVHRAPAEDPADAPEPGARAREDAVGAAAHVIATSSGSRTRGASRNDQRMDWAKGLNVPTIEDHPEPEYILWVGCAGAFDNRIKKQTRAMVKVLHAAGVDYAVLGHRRRARAIRRGAPATRCCSRCSPSRMSRR